MIALYRAYDLKKVSAGGGDEHEDITVHEVAVGEVEAFVAEKKKQGVLVDLKVYAGMYFVGKVGNERRSDEATEGLRGWFTTAGARSALTGLPRQAD